MAPDTDRGQAVGKLAALIRQIEIAMLTAILSPPTAAVLSCRRCHPGAQGAFSSRTRSSPPSSRVRSRRSARVPRARPG